MSNSKRPSRPTPSSGTPAGTKAIIAVIAVLCVLGVVWIGVSASGDDEETTGSGAASSSGEVGSPQDCAEPPTAPSAPSSYSAAPNPSVAEGSVWQATIRTNCGEITMDLFGDSAPQTVASFVTLAEDGYWVDSPCHRVTTEGIFVLQCGDPTGSGSGNPGYGYGIENAPPTGQYPRGTVAMARSTDPNSNGGQWFIVYDDSTLPTDGGGYSIFGEVTSGLEVVDAIAEAGVQGGGSDGTPAQPISILDVTVEKA